MLVQGACRRDVSVGRRGGGCGGSGGGGSRRQVGVERLKLVLDFQHARHELASRGGAEPVGA